MPHLATQTPFPTEHTSRLKALRPEPTEPPLTLTLMEIVEAVGQVAETEEEVLATMTYMLRSGRIQVAPGE